MNDILIELEDDNNTYCVSFDSIEYFWSYFKEEILDNWYCISIRFKSNLNGIQLRYRYEEDRDKTFNELKTKFSVFIRNKGNK